MIFADRAEAGRELATLLKSYASRTDVVVLGIPRGGVPVAYQIAVQLHAPLDVFIVRKLGVPGREELAFGAVASGGIRYLDSEIVEAVGISDPGIELIEEKEKQEMERRERVYRGARPPLAVEGRRSFLWTMVSPLVPVCRWRSLHCVR